MKFHVNTKSLSDIKVYLMMKQIYLVRFGYTPFYIFSNLEEIPKVRESHENKIHVVHTLFMSSVSKNIETNLLNSEK
jgi:hypothetical protein